MWQPRRLTTRWASIACCTDIFTLYPATAHGNRETSYALTQKFRLLLWTVWPVLIRIIMELWASADGRQTSGGSSAPPQGRYLQRTTSTLPVKSVIGTHDPSTWVGGPVSNSPALNRQAPHSGNLRCAEATKQNRYASKRQHGTLNSLLTAVRMCNKTGRGNVVFRASDIVTEGRNPPAGCGK
jgi:hypothetical protein